MVIGRRDKEHGPRLVKRPLKKTIKRVIGLGDSSPWVINCSLMWARSDIARAREEIES